MTELCPHCGNRYAPNPIEIGRRGYRAKSWSESPAPWIGGLTISELEILQASGLAERNAAGWWIPTELGNLALA